MLRRRWRRAPDFAFTVSIGSRSCRPSATNTTGTASTPRAGCTVLRTPWRARRSRSQHASSSSRTPRPSHGGRLGAVEDLAGGSLAGADGPVDRAVGGGGRLGAGPVDPAPRLPQEVPVAREDPGLEVGHRAAAGPLL